MGPRVGQVSFCHSAFSDGESQCAAFQSRPHPRVSASSQDLIKQSLAGWGWGGGEVAPFSVSTSFSVSHEGTVARIRVHLIPNP